MSGVKVVKKVLQSSPSVFDHFAGRPRGFDQVVCSCEFYLYWGGVKYVVVSFCLVGWLVIEYV